MKLLSVTILLICLTAATFSKWLLIACYDLNENYIAKELCVNKANTGSHCNGHCYLSRQLNKDEKPGSASNTAGKEKFEIQLFFIDKDCTGITALFINVQQCTSSQQFALQQFSRTHFRPPAV